MIDDEERKRRAHTSLREGGRARALMFGLALVLLNIARPIAEAGTPAPLDQVQSVVQGGLSVRSVAWQRIRIGRTGQVTRVDVPLCATRRGSAVVLTLGGETTGHGARASVRRTFGESLVDCTWYMFQFRRPLRARRGDMMRLAVARWSGAAPLWGASLRGHNPYRHGSGRWMNRTIDDFAFRIFVSPQGAAKALSLDSSSSAI